MNIAILAVFEAFLLNLALSMDAFVSSFAYGANRIRIPRRSVLVINLVCTIILGLSLGVGSLIQQLLPAGVTVYLSAGLLFLLGLAKLFDSSIKAVIKKHNGIHKKIGFSMFSLRFILNIYAEPEAADQDCSRELSPGEAASLAVALSFDSLGVGFGAGLANTNIWLIMGFSVLTGILAVVLGAALGNKVAQKLSMDLSWLSGVLLLVLAVLKL